MIPYIFPKHTFNNDILSFEASKSQTDLGCESCSCRLKIDQEPSFKDTGNNFAIFKINSLEWQSNHFNFGIGRESFGFDANILHLF